MDRDLTAMHDFTEEPPKDTSGTGGNPGSGSGSTTGSGQKSSIMTGGPIGPTGPTGGGGASAEDMLVNYNRRFRTADPAMHRDEVVARTITALISKNKPNALLVGPTGVGKTRIAEEIARRIAVSDASVPPALQGMTVYELPLGSLVAGAGIVGELESRLMGVIEFASDPDNKAILFIDEVHQIASDDVNQSQYQKIAQLLKPALARGDLRVIGSTTSQEARGLDEDPAFSRRFTKVIVSELDAAQTADVVRSALPSYLRHYHDQVKVPDHLVEDLVAMARAELVTLHSPDDALTLLDRSLARLTLALAQLVAQKVLPTTATMNLQRSVLKETAAAMITGDAPVHPFDEDLIRARLSAVRGQEDAIEPLIMKLRRERLGVFPRTIPLSWLFAGTSGVGKTEVATVLAQALTGAPPIKISMSEFAEKHTVSRLLGSPPGYVGSTSKKEMPLDPLEANPRRLILLDEFEKAHPDVRNVFLEALDRGVMRMASGKELSFAKAVIIATTNSGKEHFAKGGLSLGFGSGAAAPEQDNEALFRALGKDFPSEVLGRFDAVVPFRTVDRDLYTEIVLAEYQRLRESVLASNPPLGAALPEDMPDEEVEALVARTYVPASGARPAAKAVRAWIEQELDPTC